MTTLTSPCRSSGILCAALVGCVALFIPSAVMFAVPGHRPKSEYRVLWISTTVYPAKNSEEAKRQYEVNVEIADQGWARGQSNVLQRKSGNQWIDVERHDQEPARP